MQAALDSVLPLSHLPLDQAFQPANAELLQGMLAAVSDAISVTDREGRFVALNAACARLLCHPAEEVLGKTLDEIWPPKLAALLAAADREVIESGEAQVSEHRLLEGETDRVVLITRWPYRDEQGQVSGLIGVWRDLTAQRQMETALRESQQLNDQFIAQASEAIAVYDRELRVLVWNPLMEELFDKPQAEVLHKGLLEVLPQVRDTLFLKLIERALAGESVTGKDFRFPADRARWGSAHYKPLRNPNGEIVGVIMTVRDITERKIADKTVRERTDRYRDLIENSGLYIGLHDLDGRVLSLNQALLQFLGRPAADAVRHLNLRDLLAPDAWDSFPADYLEKLAREENVNGLLKVLAPNGEERIWEYHNSVRREGLKRPLVRFVAQDVTERHRAQMALRKSEERYRTILATIQDGYYEVDIAGHLTFVNRAFCRIHGYDSQELLGWSYRQYTPPDVAARVYRIFNGVYRTGRPAQGIDYEITRKDGTKRVLELSVSLICDELGSPSGFRGIVRDVSQRVRMEKTLRESEEKHRTILETIQDGYYELDLNGQLLFFNEALCKIYGRDVERIQGLAYQRWMSEAATQTLAEILHQVADTGAPVKAFDFEIVREDGTTRFIELSISLTRTADGEAAGFHGIARDVTTRKQAEQVIRESEQRFRALIEHSWEGLTLLTKDGTLNYASPAYTRISGYAAEEVLGRSSLTGVHPDDLAWVLLLHQELLENPGTSVTSEFRLQHKDGSWHWLEATFTNLLAEPSVQAIVTNFHEITERKQAEEALRSSEERYRSVVEVLGEGIFLCDTQGVYACNASAERILGLTSEQILGRNVFDPHWRMIREDHSPFPPVNHPGVVTLRTGKPCSGVVMGVYQPDGELRWISINSRPLIRPGESQVHSAVVSFADITERRRAEAALSASEERFSKAFNASPEPMAITTIPEGRYITVNQAWSRTLGFTEDEVIGRTSMELGTCVDTEQRQRLYETALAQGSVRDWEQVSRAREGQLVHFLISAELIELEGQRYLLTALRDITERKRAEVALRESELRFFTAFYSSPHPMAITTFPEGRFLNVNAAWQRTFGYTPEDALGHLSTDFDLWVDPAARAQVYEEEAKHGSLHSLEAELRTKEGAIRSCLISGQIIELGGEYCSLSTVEDITERKRAEAALRASEQRLAMAFNYSPHPLALIAFPSGRFVSVNPAWQRLLGYTASEAVGRNAVELNLWFNETERDKLYQTLAEQGSVRNFEGVFRAKSGEKRAASLTGEIIEAEGERYWFYTVEELGAGQRAD